MSRPLKPEEQPKLSTQHYDNYEDFYKDLPIEGSLGILAYGASAVLAWKKKRAENGWVPPTPVPEKPRQKKAEKDNDDE